MAWLDLNTGIVHGAVIYQDGQTVILWTGGQEAQITAAEFTEPTTFDPARYSPELVERFEDLGIVRRRRRGKGGDLRGRFLDLDPGADLPPAADARRAAIAAYAAGNGGQVIEHRAPAGGLAGLARRGRALIRRIAPRA